MDISGVKENLVPKSLHPSPTSQSTHLQITWSNGEVYELPYYDLRFLCPCAGCVDEMTGRRTLQKEGPNAIDKQIRPTQITPVGRYALQFTWSDGHATGMYHFDRLYEICKTPH